MKKYFFFLFIFLALSASEEKALRKIKNFLLLDDPYSALKIAEKAFVQYPESLDVKKYYIITSVKNGKDQELKKMLTGSLKEDEELLEEISWEILKKGAYASEYMTRLNALLASYLTHDARAVPVILYLMGDSNAVIRHLAVRFSADYQDEILKKRISSLFKKEKNAQIRLELIKAVGKMRMRSKTADLKKICLSSRSSYEEKQAAVLSLVQIYDNAELEEIERLFKSSQSVMRCLALKMIARYELKEGMPLLFKALDDPIADVVMTSMQALSHFITDISNDYLNRLKKLCTHDHHFIAVTALWLVQSIEPDFAKEGLKNFLICEDVAVRRMASAAVRASGANGYELMNSFFKTHFDPYVRVNLALGMIGIRKNTEEAAFELFDFLQNQKEFIMENDQQLFSCILPSNIQPIEQTVSYPATMDMITRLNLLSVLAVLEDPKAYDGIKDFLLKKNWGVSGFAAAALMQEGDEDALMIVKDLLNDENPDIRIQAALVLAHLGKDSSAIPVLMKTYKEADYEKKIYILEALGQVGDKKCFSFFIDNFQENFPLLKILNASALIQSMSH